MFGLSFWHIAVLAVIAFLLFGGRLSDLMGAAGRNLRQQDGLAPMLGDRLLPSFWQRLFRSLFK